MLSFLDLLGPVRASYIRELILEVGSIGPFDKAFDRLWPLVAYLKAHPYAAPNITISSTSRQQGILIQWSPCFTEALKN